MQQLVGGLKIIVAALLLSLVCDFGNVAQAEAPITACAIRWDAWYTNGPSDPAHYTALALNPERWHANAPLHARFDANGNIVWAPSEQTFNHELEVAAKAHLCWAYLMYGDRGVINLDDSMMKGLELHRQSKEKGLVKYSMILTTSVIGKAGEYEVAAQKIVELMNDKNYVRVELAGRRRPLIFLFYDSSDLKNMFQNSLAKMRESIDRIRRDSEVSGAGNPYIVIIDSPAQEAENVRAALAGDAISEYVSGTRTGHPESWKTFEPTIEKDWTAYASSTKGGTIPTLRSGADIRARCQTPPPFEHRFPPGKPCDNYTENPSIGELTQEFADAKHWVEANGRVDPARLILIYAWSECDESGNCLMPTIGDPSGKKVEAIAAALK